MNLKYEYIKNLLLSLFMEDKITYEQWQEVMQRLSKDIRITSNINLL